MKTNAIRILEQKNIPFETKSYEFDEEFSDAETAAQKVGLPPEQVFKTIVMRNEHKQIFVFCAQKHTFQITLQEVSILFHI